MTNDGMQPCLLSFRKETKIHKFEPNILRLELPPVSLRYSPVPAGVLEVVHRLASGKEYFSDVVQIYMQASGAKTPFGLFPYLQAWREHGLLCHTVPLPKGELASVVPTSPHDPFRYMAPELNTTYLLSRFAYVRRVGPHLVLESPRGAGRIVFHDEQALAIFYRLTLGTNFKELCRGFAEIPRASLSTFVGLLLGGGFLSWTQQDEIVEETRPDLQMWTFHDLLFHARSRWGRHVEPYGKTQPFLEERPPLAAVKPPMSAQGVPLMVPDMNKIERRDSALVKTMESRRSVRTFRKDGMSLVELSEFFYRTMRSEPRASGEERSYESDRRPYPSGGGCYELETYVVVSSCEGLSPGLYHYHPRKHELYPLRELNADVRGLLKDACRSTGVTDDNSEAAPILVILSARFQRVSWAYESIAYALILKHVGVIFQSMYLVATSMGLGACALGGGNADTFAKVAGLNYYEESSVGELLLGHSEPSK